MFFSPAFKEGHRSIRKPAFLQHFQPLFFFFGGIEGLGKFGLEGYSIGTAKEKQLEGRNSIGKEFFLDDGF